MTTSRFWLALALLAFFRGLAGAVDLTKIDRTIAKEPAYQSKAPKYCLLVLGPEAKTRIWLVFDDDTRCSLRSHGGAVLARP